MGYETKMLIVSKYSSSKHRTVLIEDKVYSCFEDKDVKVGNTKRTQYFYYPDGNTKTIAPDDALMKEGPWCQIIAIMDLCKVGHCFGGTCSFAESDGSYAFDPFDGNALIGLDDYGNYRKFVPIQEVIDTLQKEIKEANERGEHPYRRFIIALDLLKSLQENFSHEELGCLFYGH